MVYEREKSGYFGAGIGASLFLHGLLLFLFLIVWTKRPEPGGSGLVMDAFLINGGDGFYQPGVPWGDFNAVPGKKGAPGDTAEKSGKEKAAPLVKEQEKEQIPELPVQKTGVVEKSSVKRPVLSKKKTAAVSKKQAVSGPVEKAAAGEGGTGTPAYGGTVGDAPGFGAGRGRGTGIGSGAGVGDIRAARYFVRLRRIFQRRLKYPEEMGNQKISGKALVRFTLDENGKLDAGSVVLTETSGHELLDAQALKTIREASSLPAPPYGAVTIEIPIVFRVYH